MVEPNTGSRAQNRLDPQAGTTTYMLYSYYGLYVITLVTIVRYCSTMVCYNSPTSRLNVGYDKTTVELLTMGTMVCYESPE